MRWPVSAATHDAVLALLADERQRADDTRRSVRDHIQELHTRYDALLEKYHALKVAGGAPPQAVAERPVDVVTQAIITKSRGNPTLYAHYGSYVAKARAMHIDEEVIADAIMRGEDDDQGVPL